MTVLAGPIFDGTANVNNIAAVGGSPHVTAVESAQFVAAGMPVLADVALAAPITLKPQGLVGTRFSGWVEHRVLYVDEESEMSSPVVATVTRIQ